MLKRTPAQRADAKLRDYPLYSDWDELVRDELRRRGIRYP